GRGGGVGGGGRAGRVPAARQRLGEQVASAQRPPYGTRVALVEVRPPVPQRLAQLLEERGGGALLRGQEEPQEAGARRLRGAGVDPLRAAAAVGEAGAVLSRGRAASGAELVLDGGHGRRVGAAAGQLG